MIKARSELVLDLPFFASLALRLEMREDSDCRTAWSDGRVLAYNPDYVEAMPLDKLKGLQCHEVLHLACRHHTRRGSRDKKTWNMACDYAINPVLLDAGITLPTGYLDDPAHHGRSADAIYAALTAQDEERKGGADQPQMRDVESEELIEGASRGEESPESGSQDNSSRDKPDAAPDGLEDLSGGAGKPVEPEEKDAPDSDDPGMSGEVRDAPLDADGDGDGESLRLEEEAWDAALAQAVRKAREAGELPGGLKRLVQERLSPTLNWRDLLRRFLSNAAKNDFSWLRPNRRYLHAGLYLPGLENEELAEIAVAVDVSGSVTQPELDAFAAELSALLEEYDARVTVFTCDAGLSSQESLNKWDLPLRFTAKGGGGTDFRPPFARIQEEGLSPACLIYFTDLECASFPEAPEFPVLWVAPAWDRTPPPFGEVIVMEGRL